MNSFPEMFLRGGVHCILSWASKVSTLIGKLNNGLNNSANNRWRKQASCCWLNVAVQESEKRF